MIHTRGERRGHRVWVGTASELGVAIDLVQKGFEVFRNLSLCGPVDLIARKDDTMLRVQVKTQATEFSRLEIGNNDLFASFKGQTVVYRTFNRKTATRFGFPVILKRRPKARN
jgi:hypothetical protein